MAEKFIPDADSKFADMARNFAHGIAASPEKYSLSEDDARIISRYAQEFRDALAAATRRHSRTQQTIGLKNAARIKAEKVIRQYAKLIRADNCIDPVDKQMIGVRERPTRLSKRTCPQEPPQLRFRGEYKGMHELEFRRDLARKGKAKPFAAARLELFVDLVPPGEPIPKTPDERCKGRPWYWRSYTKSPIRVKFPLPDEPRMVVYWGRWADATGETGPFSHTIIARVEGWDANVATEARLKRAA